MKPTWAARRPDAANDHAVPSITTTPRIKNQLTRPLRRDGASNTRDPNHAVPRHRGSDHIYFIAIRDGPRARRGQTISGTFTFDPTGSPFGATLNAANLTVTGPAFPDTYTPLGGAPAIEPPNEIDALEALIGLGAWSQSLDVFCQAHSDGSRGER